MRFKIFNVENSTVILPIMTQAPVSRLAIYEPDIPKPLKERSLDMVFFGLITRRQNVLTKTTQVYMESHTGRQVVTWKNNSINAVADHYKEAKVCLIAHAYSSESAGETHRLSEFAPFGCIPVMEKWGDEFGMDRYESCSGAVFVNDRYN